ncbi:uncharacterized protein cd34 [Genypterus blacodes]|uniref:uncharacterized protein cd34 n=1 Tax=Genypterus blacodes TaxID=154954 RepID=UPI003F761A12
MMAASMWRMNELWRGTAVLLVLCALSLNNGVMCQDDATDAPSSDQDAVDATTDPVTAASGATALSSDNGDATLSPDPLNVVTIIAISPDMLVTHSQGGEDTSGTPGATAAHSAADQINNAEAVNVVDDAPKTTAPLQMVVPEVKCVGKEVIDESLAVKAVVNTANCEETKEKILKNPAPWCHTENCNLEVFQEDNTLLVSSPDAKPSTLAGALQSVKEKLGVTGIETPPASSGSSVLVAVLLTGLLLAAALIGGYCLKFRCGPETKGLKLAEEAYPVDQENQGNTLVSVAPLNPPPETPEKPSANGESPEAAKTEPPPTNGHSAAKTADTEL